MYLPSGESWAAAISGLPKKSSRSSSGGGTGRASGRRRARGRRPAKARSESDSRIMGSRPPWRVGPNPRPLAAGRRRPKTFGAVRGLRSTPQGGTAEGGWRFRFMGSGPSPDTVAAPYSYGGEGYHGRTAELRSPFTTRPSSPSRCVRARCVSSSTAASCAGSGSASARCCAGSTSRYASRAGRPSPARSRTSRSRPSPSRSASVSVSPPARSGRLRLGGPDRGGADGRIVYTLDGSAGSTFLRNRIGFCVLHPAPSCAGRPCVIETVDGERREASSRGSSRRTSRSSACVRSRTRWRPGSRPRCGWKARPSRRKTSATGPTTRSRPTALRSPCRSRSRCWRARASGSRSRSACSARRASPCARPRRSAAPCPGGAASSSPWSWSSSRPVAAAPGSVWPGPVSSRSARPRPSACVRCGSTTCAPTCTSSATEWPAALERAVANARLLERPLELALFLPDEPRPALGELAAGARALGPRVASWLVFGASDPTTHDGLAAAARETLSALDPGALFGGGTDRHFVELNRGRPSPRRSRPDRFALTPQVHAFDDATLVENLATLSWLAETARSFVPDASRSRRSACDLGSIRDPRPRASPASLRSPTTRGRRRLSPPRGPSASSRRPPRPGSRA